MLAQGTAPFKTHRPRVRRARVLELSVLPIVHGEAVVLVLPHARQQRAVLAKRLFPNTKRGELGEDPR